MLTVSLLLTAIVASHASDDQSLMQQGVGIESAALYDAETEAWKSAVAHIEETLAEIPNPGKMRQLAIDTLMKSISKGPHSDNYNGNAGALMDMIEKVLALLAELGWEFGNASDVAQVSIDAINATLSACQSPLQQEYVDAQAELSTVDELSTNHSNCRAIEQGLRAIEAAKCTLFETSMNSFENSLTNAERSITGFCYVPAGYPYVNHVAAHVWDLHVSPTVTELIQANWEPYAVGTTYPNSFELPPGSGSLFNHYNHILEAGFVGPIDTFFTLTTTRMQEWTNTYSTQYDECHAARQAADAQGVLCDGEQQALEDQWCIYRTHQTAWCEHSLSCFYLAIVAHYNLWVTEKAAGERRVNIMRIVEYVECMLELLKTNEAAWVNTNGRTQCRTQVDETPSVSHRESEYGVHCLPIQDIVTCDHNIAMPTEAAWRDEYLKTADYSALLADTTSHNCGAVPADPFPVYPPGLDAAVKAAARFAQDNWATYRDLFQ